MCNDLAALAEVLRRSVEASKPHLSSFSHMTKEDWDIVHHSLDATGEAVATDRYGNRWKI